MILEGYRKFITHTCSFKKSQQSDVKNKSFQYLKSMIHDPLLPAKFMSFQMVYSKLNAFLRGFQTNKPMVTFKARYPRAFFGRIILKDVLKKKSNLYNLIHINPLDKNIRKNPEGVNIRFAAKHKLEQIKSSLNSAKILEFKKQAGYRTTPPLSRKVTTQIRCCTYCFMSQPNVNKKSCYRNPVYKKSSCESQMDIIPQKFLVEVFSW